MKLSLKRISGKLRFLVQRFGAATRFVSDCCCITNTVHAWAECCDGNPRIYISFATLDRVPCTSTVIKYGPNCYRQVPFSEITKQEAIDLGYTIVDDPALITCVPAGCEEPPCRVCPQDCCLIEIIPTGCRTELDPSPANNQCCNYGRVARRFVNDITRDEFRSRISLNASAGDTYCPPGCTTGLQKTFRLLSTSYEEEASFQRCNDDGVVDERTLYCTASDYRREEQSTRRYGFEGSPDQPCLGFTDSVQADEFRNQDCKYSGSLLGFDFPPPLVNPDTQELECQIFDRQSGPIADDNNPPGEWYYTENLARERGCFTGSYTYSLVGVKRAYAGSECPPPGTVVATSSYSRTFTYSIQSTDSDFCEGNAYCERYLEGRRQPLPLTDPLDDVGALGLL